MSRKSCPECDRLWREYASATTEHVTLVGKLNAAVARKDAEAVKRLELEVETAHASRDSIRQQVLQHEARHE